MRASRNQALVLRPGPNSSQSRLLRCRVRFGARRMHECLRLQYTTACLPREDELNSTSLLKDLMHLTNYAKGERSKMTNTPLKASSSEENDLNRESPGGSQALDFSIMQAQPTATVSIEFQRMDALSSWNNLPKASNR